MAMLTWPLGVWLGPILVASAGLRMGVWGLTGKHPSVGSLSPQGWRTAGFQCTPHSMLEVWQSWPRARPSSATSPSPTGAAAAGGHRAGLPRPGPSLPALLLLLAVLPTAQERGASGCRLLLHRLVRDHRHAGLQVSAGPGLARWGRGRKGGFLPPPVGPPPCLQAMWLHPPAPRPILALASLWGSMATGRPVTASIGPPTRSATPTAQWQGSRTA